MPKFKAFYTDYPWPDVELERFILEEAGCELAISSDNQEQTLIEQVGDADVILTCWAPVTAAVIAAAPKCRHIARTGIGLDNIDVAAATDRGILVTNVPDYCVEEVAEHNVALMFALARKVADSHWATKRGEYDLVAALPITRLRGKTAGLVGLGGIGKLTAEKLNALGMNVIGTNRSQQTPVDVEWRTLEDLLAESDFVVLCCPLTDQTHEMMRTETFEQMKPTAHLINTSRGGLVNHADLAAALDGAELSGAALDVQVPEPPNLSKPPYNDPRVIVTPHTAFCSPEAIHELRSRVGRQVAAFLRGKTPDNVVNPEVLS